MASPTSGVFGGGIFSQMIFGRGFLDEVVSEDLPASESVSTAIESITVEPLVITEPSNKTCVMSGTFGKGQFGQMIFGRKCQIFPEYQDLKSEDLSLSEILVSEIDHDQSESLSISEIQSSEISFAPTEDLSAVESWSSEISSINYDNLSALETCASEIASINNDILLISEIQNSELADSVNEIISFSESIVSTYEMSYNEIISVVEIVISEYSNFISFCIPLKCDLSKYKPIELDCSLYNNKPVELNCRLTCT